MGIRQICEWVGGFASKGLYYIDASSHEFFEKSPELKAMLGRSEEFSDKLLTAGGKNNPAESVAGKVMKAYRDAVSFLREAGTPLAEEAPENAKKYLDDAIKGDIVRLRKNRQEFAKVSEEVRQAAKDGKKIPAQTVAYLDKLKASVDLDNLDGEDAPFQSLTAVLGANLEKVEPLLTRQSIVDAYRTTEEMFSMQDGLDFDKMLEAFSHKESIYKGSFFEAMYDKSYGSMRHFLVSAVDVTGMTNEAAAEKKIMDYLYTVLDSSRMGVVVPESSVKNLMDNMLGKSSASNFWQKFLTHMRPGNAFLKYTIGSSGAVVLANSLLMNMENVLVRVVGNRRVYEHSAVDSLLSDFGFLASQSRLQHDLGDPDLMGSGFTRLVNMALGKLPEGKIKSAARDVLTSGIHASADWGFDNTAKRTAVMEALLKSPFGQSPDDLDKFGKILADYKGGKLNDRQAAMVKAQLDNLRADAVISYDQYFTNSGLAALSKNRLSRGNWLALNCLSGYMVKRGSDVTRPLRRMAELIGEGRWSEVTKDPELARLVAATIWSAKVGAAAGRSLDAKNDDETARAYALDLNDFYQGLTQNFVARIFSAGIRGWDNSVTLSDIEGKPHKVVDGVSSAAYGMLAGAFVQGFKELKPLNSLGAFVQGVRQTGDMGFAMAVTEDEVNSVLQGMGKFAAMPGFETAGMKKVPQRSDLLSTVVMDIGEVNKSMAASMEARDLAATEEFLRDPKAAVASLVMNLPVVKSFLSDNSFTMSKYGEYAKLLDSDKDFAAIIGEGKLPENFFTKPRVIKFWKELTSFNMEQHKVSETGKAHQFSEGTHDSKKMDLFLEQLGKKMGHENLAKFVSQFQPNVNAQQFARIIAFAENDVPGSGRILLSYAAQKRYESAKQSWLAANGQRKGDDLLIEQDDAIKASILSDMYPLLYAADKTSFAKAAVEYAAEKSPLYFSKDAMSDDKVKNLDDPRTFVNSMALIDMAVATEWKSGNPSATWMKSVMSTAMKYVEDPSMRTRLVEHAMASVDSFPATKEDKFAIKLGILAGNVDHLADMGKDKVFLASPENEAAYKRALDVFWSGHSSLMDTASRDGLLTSANEDLLKALGYYAKTNSTSYGSSSYRKPGNSRSAMNSQATDSYLKSVPRLTAATPSWYSYPKSGGYSSRTNPNNAWDGKPYYAKDPKWDAYLVQLGAAESKSIVSGYVEHAAGDKDPMSVKITGTALKWKNVAKKKLKVEKVRWRNISNLYQG